MNHKVAVYWKYFIYYMMCLTVYRFKESTGKVNANKKIM